MLSPLSWSFIAYNPCANSCICKQKMPQPQNATDIHLNVCNEKQIRREEKKHTQWKSYSAWGLWNTNNTSGKKCTAIQQPLLLSLLLSRKTLCSSTMLCCFFIHPQALFHCVYFIFKWISFSRQSFFLVCVCLMCTLMCYYISSML